MNKKYQDPDVGLGFFRGVDGFSKNIHTFFRPFFRLTKMIVHANIYEKARKSVFKHFLDSFDQNFFFSTTFLKISSYWR